MVFLSGKKILLGVTGSIAAYKAAELIRLLKKHHAEVRVVMTQDAGEFVTELSLQALSGHPVHKELLDSQREASMSHITLARWADLVLVAPATANSMAKFANGLADDLLSTLFLACNTQIALAPAMNQQMWLNQATQFNKQRLVERGTLIWGPNSGEQACGEKGPGRMLEPEELLAHMEIYFTPKLLSGLKIVITAGPTREPIDPVRYISNHSSGKMGYALAEAALQLGASVTLISGPCNLIAPYSAELINVETAREMYTAVMTAIADAHIFIAAAAVSDYCCQEVALQKLKKDTANPLLQLKKNPDILQAVSKLSSPPFLVGFAAETQDLIRNARQKYEYKNLDIMIANKVGNQVGFNVDCNEVVVITASGEQSIPLQSKKTLAKALLPIILTHYRTKQLAAAEKI